MHANALQTGVITLTTDFLSMPSSASSRIVNLVVFLHIFLPSKLSSPSTRRKEGVVANLLRWRSLDSFNFDAAPD